MLKAAAAFFVAALSACSLKPMYETDYPLYREYKYWETSDKDWYETDNFKILVNRYHENDTTTLRLVPQRKGLPSIEKGYVYAAQKTAFNIMTSDCGSPAYTLLPSVRPRGGRRIDRYFFQNADLSVGVSYVCQTGKPNENSLFQDAQKWSLAERRWDKIDNINAYVDTLPVNNDGLHQMRIRLFGGTVNDNKRLARRLILDACDSTTDFKILFDEPGADLAEHKGQIEIVSDDNVRIYGFVCRLVP